MVFRLSLCRLAHIAGVAFKHAVAHGASLLLARRPDLARRLGVRTVSGPVRLRMLMEDAGGTFIKFGQMLALQPDILSLEYCNALFDLLDRVEPFAYENVERTFVEEFGRKPSEMFDTFECRPLATASIGQVHVAHLGGRKLAVKVQRPNVETDFAGDIRLMSFAVRAIKRLRLQSLSWMIEPLSEFVMWTREELDYRREARYMEHLRENASDNACERVPEVLREYTTRRTLVLEFLEGVTVLDYLRALERGDEELPARLRDANFDADEAARNIINNFLGDAFRHGMFHADLHPANLMLLPDSVVGYIDFGITGVLSHHARQSLIALTLAYTRGDLEGMCASVLRVSTTDETSDVEGYREGLRRLEEQWYETDGGGRRLRKNFSLVMLDMLVLSRKTNIWPERGVIKYIRSSIAIDGLITRFAPAFNLGEHLGSVCKQFLKWQTRRALFSYNTLAGWSFAGTRLVGDGAFRAADMLRRMADGEMPARAEIGRGPERADEALRARAFTQATAALGVALLAAVTHERAQFGPNLFTAEVLFVLAALAMLVRTVGRLRAA